MDIDQIVAEAQAVRRAPRDPFVLYYPKLRIAYNYIPKNGCSTVKATLGAAEDPRHFATVSDDLDAIHDEMSDRFSEPPPCLDRSWTRLLVVRDPYERLISAYLQKVVRPRTQSRKEMVKEIARVNGRELEAQESVSFLEFVRWFVEQPVELTDAHWAPQSTMLRFDTYHHVLRTDSLADGWRSAGLDKIAPLREWRVHATKNDRATELPLKQPLYDTPGHFLWGYRRTTGQWPPRICFYNAEALELVRRYYRDDYVLLELVGLGGLNPYIQPYLAARQHEERVPS